MTQGRRSEEHTSELQSRENPVCRLLLEKKNRVRRILRRGRGPQQALRPCPERGERPRGSSFQLRPSLRASISLSTFVSILFFFNDTATTKIYTLSLHDALPI